MANTLFYVQQCRPVRGALVGLRSFWKGARVRIVVVVGLIGLVLSANDAFEPLDELIYSGEAYLLRRPASDQVVVIQITPEEAAKTNWPWDNDRWSDMIVRVAKLNPKSVFVDFLFVRQRPAAEEARLERVLALHGDKFIFGTMFEWDEGRKKIVGVAPIRPFLERSVQLATINYRSHELGDFREAPYALSYFGKTYPSAPAALLGINRPPGTAFKVDKTIDLRTIRRFSYEQLVAGEVSPKALAGKYVLVIGGFFNTDEHVMIPYVGVSGGLLHAMGTLTLIGGPPVYVAPLIIFAFVFLFGLYLHWRVKQIPPWPLYFGVSALIIVLSFVLIKIGFIIPVGSAIAAWSMMAWSDSWVRMRERSISEGAFVNATSGLPNFEALERLPANPDVAVVAAQLPGLELALRSSRDRNLTIKFADLVVGDTNGPVYDAGHGTLLWLHPLVAGIDLVDHLDRLSGSVVSHEFGEGLPEHAPHFGVDLDTRAAMISRAASALEASVAAKSEGTLLRSGPQSTQKHGLELNSIATVDALMIAYRPLKSVESDAISGAMLQVLDSDAEETNIALGSDLEREAAFALFEKMLGDASELLKAVLPFQESFQAVVPLSATALLNPYLLETVRGAIRRRRLAAEDFSFVIHLPALHLAGGRGLKVLAELRSLGVEIALSGFDQHDRGVDYVRSIPATQLLSDERFSCLSVEENWRLAQSTVALARQLGRSVTFIGVSDSRSVRLLESLAVDRIEGPAVAACVSHGELIALLASPPAKSPLGESS